VVTVQRFDTEADWLAARGDSIGASEVPSLFHEGFLSRERLIAEKAGAAPRKRASSTKKRLEAGRLLEPVVGTILALDLKRPIIPCGYTIYRNPLFPFLHATPDFWVVEGEELAEAKTTGPDGLSGWGDWSGFQGRWKWAEEPPAKVAIQIQAQFAATGAQRGHIACLAGPDFKRWAVERDDEFIALIGAEVARAIHEIHEQRERVSA